MTARDPAGKPAWVGDLQAVTFDFGNTLVPVAHEDLRRVVALTVETVLGDRAHAERDDFLTAWAEERERQFAEEVPQFREVDIAQRFVRVFARRRGMAPPSREERWDDVAAAAYSDDREVVLAVDAYVDAFVASLPVPAAVGPLLSELSLHYRLAVLSNWPVARAIDRYVEVAGWGPYLDALVVSQRVGAIKPRPEIFRAAETALGGRFAAGSILHVGDDWAADVVGAKEAGWRAAYLRVRPDSPLPSSLPDGRVGVDLEIDRLVDLGEVLLVPAGAG